MRNLIIGLSTLFLILSGIVTLKTSGLPAKNISDQNIKFQRIQPGPENFPAQSAGEQAADKAAIDELQATIAMLEKKISSGQKESRINRETVDPERGEKILAVLGSGTFSSGQIVIDEHLVNVVKESVREISASPDHRVRIEGHTDNIPIRITSGKQYTDNMGLSYLRATTIAGILVKYGIPPEQISVIGYGDTRPIASNDTKEGRAKNRRVEIKLIPEKKEL